MQSTNKTRKARTTIIIGLFLINAIASTGWAGELVMWGQDRYVPFSQTPAGDDFVAVSASDTHCIAMKSDGSLVSWGQNNYGQVSNTPSGTGFKAAAAGVGHSVAVRSDGSLISWGDDAYGQVSDTPAGTGFKAVTAGNGHSVALKTDGSLVAWGNNNYFQVSRTPSGNDFVAVVAGYYHNVALKIDGSLVAWGYNNAHQVSYTPTGTGFKVVTAGNQNNVAVKPDGSLVNWGYDAGGALSNVPAGNDFIDVTAGSSHSVALKSDGSLVAWGNNYYGSVSNTPTGTGFTAIAAAGYYNVAVRGTQTPPPIPTVSIAATDASAAEPANNGTFTVSRTGDTSSSLRVYYSTSGSTASAGADYASLPGYVDIPAGQYSASIPVTVYDDSTVESSETVRLTISSNAAYTIGSPSYATVTITDNDVVPVTPTVTITATDASAGEPSNNGSFAVSRTGDTSSNLLVYYSTSGSTASAGADYAALPGYVYIYAGQSTASIPVTVYNDSTAESSETVRLTISSSAAYNIGSPSYATVTITDDDDPAPAGGPVVTITAPDASAGEPANDGYFTVTRTGDTASSLLVYYSTSGTATAGTDYAALYGYVYIPYGQTSTDIYVSVNDDSIAENSETVNLTISNNTAYSIGSPGSATVTIADDDTSTPEISVVTITAPDASAGEPSNNGYFTVSRTGATSSNLLVYYSTSGSTASAGTDYAALPGYVYILAGQYSASIPVTVYDDSTVESSETVRVTISSNAAYNIGSPNYATVTITDDDTAPQETPVVTITAPDASAGEPSNNGYFTVSRTGDTSSTLLVYYSTSGSTATAGTDYASLPGYIYIPAGQYSASIPVTVYDDTTIENTETVRLTISSNSAYTIGSPYYATVTITDDDVSVPPPPVNNAEQMMTDTLDFFYLSVDQGYLEGVGKNKGFKDKALNSFQTMLETALRLIKERDYNGACSQLSDALSGCDGLPNPTDYVSGQATATLADMIRDVMAELGC